MLRAMQGAGTQQMLPEDVAEPHSSDEAAMTGESNISSNWLSGISVEGNPDHSHLPNLMEPAITRVQSRLTGEKLVGVFGSMGTQRKLPACNLIRPSRSAEIRIMNSSRSSPAKRGGQTVARRDMSETSLSLTRQNQAQNPIGQPGFVPSAQILPQSSVSREFSGVRRVATNFESSREVSQGASSTGAQSEASQSSVQTPAFELNSFGPARLQPSARLEDEHELDIGTKGTAAPANPSESQGFRPRAPQSPDPLAPSLPIQSVNDSMIVPSSDLTPRLGQPVRIATELKSAHPRQKTSGLVSVDRPEMPSYNAVREAASLPVAYQFPQAHPGRQTFSQATLDAGKTSQDAFAALDTELAPPVLRWVHASPQRAEAGFQDPSLGWISVRAQSDKSGLHASIVPSTPDAAQVLNSHLGALNADLAKVQTNLHALTMSAPELAFGGNDLGGGMQGGRDGNTRHEAPEEQLLGRPGFLRTSASLSTAEEQEFSSRSVTSTSTVLGGMHISVVV
jgi:hypothetical protein